MKGFTLIELILVIAIIAVFAGAMIPIIREGKDETKIVSILQLIDTLKFACQKYQSDTGSYAQETSFHFLPIFHQLSMDDGSSLGWDGPYINRPLSNNDNPYYKYRTVNFSCVVMVEPTLSGIYTFDLDGNGSIDRSGPGNALTISNFSRRVARKINDHFDTNIPGDWKTTGRVKLIANTRLAIYLIGGY